MKQLSNIMTMYAVSPIHAGAESSTGVIDNPIQREVHTGYPLIQANGVKGAMRSHFRTLQNNGDTINFIFGTDDGNDGKKPNFEEEKDGEKKRVSMAAAIAVSDAKLFAMPVRSNIAPFVWVTCPTILKRFDTDLQLAGLEHFQTIPEVDGDNAQIIGDWNATGEIILEDSVVMLKEKKIGATLIHQYFPDVKKLLLVSDDMFKYVSENCTEVQTQIKIDDEKGTAKEGGLRYEELLPSDSVLYTVVMYDDAHFNNELQAEAVKKKIEDSFSSFMQIGGDATLGRGIVKLSWMKGGEQ